MGNVSLAGEDFSPTGFTIGKSPKNGFCRYFYVI